jgi:nucleotide-binding universal stress UspA family protein
VTHEERLALIYKPMPWRVLSFANVIPPAYRWAGAMTGARMDLLSGRTAEDLYMNGLSPEESRDLLEAETAKEREQREQVDAHLQQFTDNAQISLPVWEAIADSLILGATENETAARVGVNPRTVRRVRKRLGLQLKQREDNQ